MSQLSLLRDILAERPPPFNRIAYYIDNYSFQFDVEGLDVLDVGGGAGTAALYLRIVRGAHVDVLDEFGGHGGPESNREELRRRLGLLGITDMRLIEADMRSASIPDATYDVIYARNSLHHVFESDSSMDRDVVRTLTRMHGWVRPGGVLVIGEVGSRVIWRVVPSVIRDRFLPHIYPSGKSSFRRWRSCAEQAGFRFERVQWYVPWKLSKWRGLLGNELCNMLLTASYILHMRKPQ